MIQIAPEVCVNMQGSLVYVWNDLGIFSSAIVVDTLHVVVDTQNEVLFTLDSTLMN